MSRVGRRKQKFEEKSDFQDDENFIEVKKKKPSSPKKNQDPVTTNSTTDKKATKPIFIKFYVQAIKDALKYCKLQEKPYYKILGNSFTSITALNLTDKQKIMKYLKIKNIEFHTYAEPSEKSTSCVMKGFYETSSDELMKSLKEAKVPATKATVLINKPDFNIYLVHFDKSVDININVLNHNHGVVDDVRVRWEKFKSNKKQPTQCYKCQEWGHSSQNCNNKFKCVKCIDDHAPGQCKRTSKEGSPKCVNCKGDHAASYRLCPSFIAYSKRIERSKAKTQIKLLPQVSSLVDNNNFPPLLKRHQVSVNSNPLNVGSNSSIYQEEINQQQLMNKISYAEKLSESLRNENLLKKFTEAQERLKRIPNIEEAINQYCSFVDQAEKLPNDGSTGPLFNLMLKFGNVKSLSAANKPVQ